MMKSWGKVFLFLFCFFASFAGKDRELPTNVPVPHHRKIFVKVENHHLGPGVKDIFGVAVKFSDGAGRHSLGEVFMRWRGFGFARPAGQLKETQFSFDDGIEQISVGSVLLADGLVKNERDEYVAPHWGPEATQICALKIKESNGKVLHGVTLVLDWESPADPGWDCVADYR